MPTAVAAWLDRVGGSAFTLSAWAFVLMNGAALAIVAWKRDRAMVNRWTSRVLVANVFLLGTGLGIPLATKTARAVLRLVAPSVSVRATPDAGEVPASPRRTPLRP